MKNNKILIYALSTLTLLLFFYIIHFMGMPLSKHTSDWGAFGNYMGMGISVISISLIYITYREQRESNISMRYERHVLSMTKNMYTLYEKNQYRIEESYSKFCRHFLISFFDLSVYGNPKVYHLVIEKCTTSQSLAKLHLIQQTSK